MYAKELAGAGKKSCLLIRWKNIPNVTALEAVQPQDLTAGEIDVRLGATWLPQEDIQQFVLEFLKPGYYAESRIKVHYSPYTATWNIEGKKG